MKPGKQETDKNILASQVAQIIREESARHVKRLIVR